MNKIEQILKSAKNIAIIGLSPDEQKDSNKVAKYLIYEGFNIFPVYPKYDEILGCKVYRSLNEILAPVDIVVMFRKSEYGVPLVQDTLENGAKCLWLQLGISNETARENARKSSLDYVQNRCIMIELERIKGKI